VLTRFRNRRDPVPAASGPASDPELPIDREGLDNHSLVLLMAARLDADSVFVDIGANEGRFLYAARDLAPRGRHIAIEPLPELAETLRERFPEVTLHNVALSDGAGTAEFVRVLDDRGYSGLAERPYPGDYKTERIQVDVARLDDLVPEDVTPAFVKIDVEGAELATLRGAVKTLKRALPWVVFEHGPGTSAVFGATSVEVWDVLCDEVGLRVYDMDGRGPLGRADFDHIAATNTRWNWFARP